MNDRVLGFLLLSNILSISPIKRIQVEATMSEVWSRGADCVVRLGEESTKEDKPQRLMEELLDLLAQSKEASGRYCYGSLRVIGREHYVTEGS